MNCIEALAEQCMVCEPCRMNSFILELTNYRKVKNIISIGMKMTSTSSYTVKYVTFTKYSKIYKLRSIGMFILAQEI
jgi:hypothetical protein